jgi:hypothetical protein
MVSPHPFPEHRLLPDPGSFRNHHLWMVSQGSGTPVKTGVQDSFNELKPLDAVFRRDGEKRHLLTSYEIIIS